MKWRYLAHDAAGKMREGEVEAKSEEDANWIVRNELGLFARKVEMSSSELPPPAPKPAPVPKPKLEDTQAIVKGESKAETKFLINRYGSEIPVEDHVREKLKLMDVVLHELELKYPTNHNVVNMARDRMIQRICDGVI